MFDDTVAGNVALDRAGVDAEDVAAALRLAQADGVRRATADGRRHDGGRARHVLVRRSTAAADPGPGPGRAPRLLVLDDATSAVDPRVEAAILAGLRARRASVLVVAYRRATIALADEVVYLEHGRVVARGTHAELLATTPGYVDLVTAYEKAEAERELHDESTTCDGRGRARWRRGAA